MFFTIMKKELKESLRDRRSLIMMILPFFIFPLLFMFYSYQNQEADKSVTSGFSVAVKNDDSGKTEALIAALKQQDMALKVVKSEDTVKAMKDGEIALVLDWQTPCKIVYDQTSMRSAKALSIIITQFEYMKKQTVINVLGDDIEKLSKVEEYDYTYEDVSSYSQTAGNGVVAILAPMLIVMFIVSGGSGVAIDFFAGEKERGSLEGILITQANRKAVYFAKATVVCIYVLFSSILSLSGYIIPFLLIPSFGEIMGGDLYISPLQLINIVLAVVPLSALCAALISLFSLSAKTVREAQTKISIITILPSILGCASLYIENIGTSVAVFCIPFVNAVFLLKKIFLNTALLSEMIVYLITTVCLICVFCALGLKLINSEKTIAA